MPCPKKNILISEDEVLRSLSGIIRDLFKNFTYRDARASAGVSYKQYYEILRGEPVNFTFVTLRRIAFATGTSAASIMAEAEANVKRISS